MIFSEFLHDANTSSQKECHCFCINEFWYWRVSMCFLCFDPLLCLEAFNSISWFLSGWAEMVEPSWDNCPGCIWTRCTAPFMSKRLTAAPDQIYTIIYNARAQRTALCHSSWQWRQIKKRLFIAHLRLFVRELHCAVCCRSWKIRMTNDVSVVIRSA